MMSLNAIPDMFAHCFCCTGGKTYFNELPGHDTLGALDMHSMTCTPEVGHEQKLASAQTQASRFCSDTGQLLLLKQLPIQILGK